MHESANEFKGMNLVSWIWTLYFSCCCCCCLLLLPTTRSFFRQSNTYRCGRQVFSSLRYFQQRGIECLPVVHFPTSSASSSSSSFSSPTIPGRRLHSPVYLSLRGRAGQKPHYEATHSSTTSANMISGGGSKEGYEHAYIAEGRIFGSDDSKNIPISPSRSSPRSGTTTTTTTVAAAAAASSVPASARSMEEVANMAGRQMEELIRRSKLKGVYRGLFNITMEEYERQQQQQQQQQQQPVETPVETPTTNQSHFIDTAHSYDIKFNSKSIKNSRNNNVSIGYTSISRLFKEGRIRGRAGTILPNGHSSANIRLLEQEVRKLNVPLSASTTPTPTTTSSSSSTAAAAAAATAKASVEAVIVARNSSDSSENDSRSGNFGTENSKISSVLGEFAVDSLRLQILMNELERAPMERHTAIIDTFEDLLLSDNLLPLLKAANASKTLGGQEAERYALIVERTVALMGRLSDLFKLESERHLNTISEICGIAAEFQHDEEAFLDKIELIKPKFDTAFLSYLNYAISEAEKQYNSGIDKDTAWLNVLRLIRQAVLAEFESRHETAIEALLLVIRFDDREIRRQLFQRFVNITTATELPFMRTLASNMIDSVLNNPETIKALSEVTSRKFIKANREQDTAGENRILATIRAENEVFSEGEGSDNPLDRYLAMQDKKRKKEEEEEEEKVRGGKGKKGMKGIPTEQLNGGFGDYKLLTRKMKDLALDINTYLSDDIITEKLKEYQKAALKQGTVVEAQLRNPERQMELQFDDEAENRAAGF